MFTIIVLTIVTGVVLGFAVSARTPTDGLEDLTRNVLIGMIGAFAGLQVVGRTFGSGAGASWFALLVAALAGASLALFVVNRMRRA